LSHPQTPHPKVQHYGADVISWRNRAQLRRILMHVWMSNIDHLRELSMNWELDR
jgi:hypothetical protein